MIKMPDEVTLKDQQRTLPSCRKGILRMVLCLALFIFGGVSLEAQTSRPSREEVELALLVKMLPYTQWCDESEPEVGPIGIGIYGEKETYERFRKTLKKAGKDDHLHPILIGSETSDAELEHLKVIYFPDNRPTANDPILRRLQQRPVLLMGSRKDFLERGGIVRFDLEGEQIKFDIHVGWAERNGIKFRAALLRLARKVESDSAAHGLRQPFMPGGALSDDDDTVSSSSVEDPASGMVPLIGADNLKVPSCEGEAS